MSKHFFSITILNAWLVVSSFRVCATQSASVSWPRPSSLHDTGGEKTHHRHKNNNTTHSSSTFLFTFTTSDPSFPMYAASPEHAANIIKYNWVQAEKGIYASLKTLSVRSKCVIWDLDARQGTYPLYTSLLGCNVMAVFHPTVHIGFENPKRDLLKLSIAKNRVNHPKNNNNSDKQGFLLPLEPMDLPFFSPHNMPPSPAWLLHTYGIALPHNNNTTTNHSESLLTLT